MENTKHEIKEKGEINKTWKIVENIIIGVVLLTVSFPIFIIIHRNIPNWEWPYNIDRILLYLLIVLILYLCVRFIRRLFVVICIGLLLFLIEESMRGGYGFTALADDYEAMVLSMQDSDKPEVALLNKLAFNSSNAKIIRAMDYTNPEVRNFALQATNKYFREYQKNNRYRAIIQAFAIFKEINSQWHYVNDPVGQEYYAKASESIKTLSGDCDDHSILMAACIRIIGGTPRLVYTENHIYPEIYIGDEGDLESINYLIKHKLFPKESKGKKLYYHLDQDGRIWLNLDYSDRYPGAPFLGKDVLDIIEL